jgi:hypothetical protein
MPFTANRLNRPAVTSLNNAGVLGSRNGPICPMSNQLNLSPILRRYARPASRRAGPVSPMPQDPVFSRAAEAQRHLPFSRLAVLARTHTNGEVISQLQLYAYACLSLSMADGSQ